MSEDTTFSLSESDADNEYDLTLRPKNMDEFIGQSKIKNNLSISLEAAKRRGEPVGHILLYGAPGLGKTTLAHIIAREMNTHIRVTSGPAIERAGDLAAILTNLEDGDILFIDEIHRLNKVIEEVLYPAMEDWALDIVVGKGPSARTLRLELPHFTLVGATTKLSMLSSPLRDRFVGIWRLDYYNFSDMATIVQRSASILSFPITHEIAKEIGLRARRTPRIANRLLRHVRDFSDVRGSGSSSLALCRDALSLLDVDDQGLDDIDRRLLTTMIDKFCGGPVGLSTLAASTGEEMATIEEVYEPYLMQLGFLTRTPRGRVATPSAYEHLGLEIPDSLQEKLL